MCNFANLYNVGGYFWNLIVSKKCFSVSRRVLTLFFAIWFSFGLLGNKLLGNTALAHEINYDSYIDFRVFPSETKIDFKIPIGILNHQKALGFSKDTEEQELRDKISTADMKGKVFNFVKDQVYLKDSGKVVPLQFENIQMTSDKIIVQTKTPNINGTLEFTSKMFPEYVMHRVFVSVYREHTLIAQYTLKHADPTFKLEGPKRPIGEIIVSFIKEGIHHIFIGPDHILFILALILLGGSILSQIKIITAFTVAHSVTLMLATFGVVQLPSRFVESVIAFSIFVVAIYNIWNLWKPQYSKISQTDMSSSENKAGDQEVSINESVHKNTRDSKNESRIWFAFIFGLIHGFGFASVLQELELPQYALAWSLVSFNIGVEIGQVMIILAAFPFFFLLRRYLPPKIAQWCLISMSACVGIVGLLWFLERAI